MIQVRAAQSLTLLSHSLKLSLLLSQEPIDSADQEGVTLDEEAISLMKSTADHRKRCAHIIEEMFDLTQDSEAEDEEGEKGQDVEMNEDPSATDSTEPIEA
jgi:hypothetical protein